MPTDLERRFAEFNDAASREGRAAEQRSLEERFRANQADQAQGGSIRQGEPSQNLPVGATVGAIGGAMVGGAIAGPPGAVAGGLAGTAVGELAQQAYEVYKDCDEDNEQWRTFHIRK